MRVLVACEFTGRVRDAFAELGHDAWSCDLEDCERVQGSSPKNRHLQMDALEAIYGYGPWDLMVAHPPCTYLSRAGARWWKQPGRDQKAREATEFVLSLWNAPIERIAIENPIGQLNRRWRYPDQTIQPWQFGHPFTKATCLWLKNLPPLVYTEICTERTAFLPSNTGWNARKGQRTQAGVVTGGKDASRTFPGIAKAMAAQWGGRVEERIAA
jgi:hypothetical protein